MDTIALKDLHLAIIQPDRNGDDITSCRSPEPSMNGRIQVDAFSNLIELLHSNVKGILLAAHSYSPFLNFAQR
jgi:hypothetical protein